MSIFKDPGCLDRIGVVIAGVAGVAGSTSGGPIVAGAAAGGALLAAACAGRAAMLDQVNAKQADASHVIGEFVEEFKTNWQDWSNLTPSEARSPQDLESAALSFEEYFEAGDVRSLPTADTIVRLGKDPSAVTQEMLRVAERLRESVYSDTPNNAFNRKFFVCVIETALRRLFAKPAYAEILQPAFQTLVIEDLGVIKSDLSTISSSTATLHEKIDHQAEQYQTKEQYLRRLHAIGRELEARRVELRRTIERLERSESQSKEHLEQIVDAKADLRVIERERSALEKKLAEVETSYRESQRQLTSALSKLPENRVEEVRAKIAQSPESVPDEMVEISDEMDVQSAAIKFEAANLYRDQIRYNEALAQYQKACALDEKNPLYLDRLGTQYQEMGVYGDAEPQFVESLAIRRKQLGDQHPDVASSLNNLAELYRAQCRYSEAEPLYGESLAIWRKQLGDQHPDVATSLNNLAGLYTSQGRYREAEPLYGESLAIVRKQLGDQHPDVASSLNNLAGLYESQGRYSEAEPLYLEGLRISRKQLGDQHPAVATSLNNLAALYRAQGRYSEAEPLFGESLAIRRKQLGDQHPSVAGSLNNLAALYTSQGRYSEAESLYGESLAILRKQLGDEHPYVATSLNNLAELYRAQGRFSEAEPLYIEAIAILEKAVGSDHPKTNAAKANYEHLKSQM